MSNIEIARQAKMQPILKLARERLGIPEEALEPYGRFKAKVSLDYLKTLQDRPRLLPVRNTTIDYLVYRPSGTPQGRRRPPRRWGR